jgi:hypothetical protein
MVRHRLIPCGIVGQISYAQAKLLRDESGEIMGYRSPVAYQLREGDARMPQKGELQRDAQPGSVAKIVKLEHAWRRLDGRNDDGFQVAPFPG